jgi:hypothetical protein
MDENITEQPTKVAASKAFTISRLKKLSLKVKVAVAAGLVVLVGGGAALAVSALNSPDALVGIAIGSLFGEAHPSFEIGVDVESQGVSGSGTLDVYTADSGALVSLNAVANLGTTPVGATLNLMRAKSGDVYLGLTDFDSLSNYLILSGMVPAATVTKVANVLSSSWVKITKEELKTYGQSLSGSTGNSCLTDKLNNADYTKKVQQELVNILRSNNFLKVSKELPQVGADRLFEIGVDAPRLKSFLKAVKASNYYSDLHSCVPSLDISDATIAEITQANLDNAFGGTLAKLTTTVYVNASSRKLDKLIVKVAQSTSGQTLTVGLKPLGDQASKVVIPEKSISSTELILAISTPQN